MTYYLHVPKYMYESYVSGTLITAICHPVPLGCWLGVLGRDASVNPIILHMHIATAVQF